MPKNIFKNYTLKVGHPMFDYRQAEIPEIFYIILQTRYYVVGELGFGLYRHANNSYYIGIDKKKTI